MYFSLWSNSLPNDSWRRWSWSFCGWTRYGRKYSVAGFSTNPTTVCGGGGGGGGPPGTTTGANGGSGGGGSSATPKPNT